LLLPHTGATIGAVFSIQVVRSHNDFQGATPAFFMFASMGMLTKEGSSLAPMKKRKREKRRGHNSGGQDQSIKKREK